MASWTTYRGMNVPDVSTGDAGDYLTDNFEELANRAAQANFAATSNPGAGDDIGDGYYPGSHWLNTTTDTMFICVDNTATAAVWQEIGSGTGDGSVTSVGLSLPALFSVSGSPVTTSGTLTGSLANQSANELLAGPSTGSPAAPSFRSLITADLPDDGVTDAKLRNSAPLSVIGRAANSSGDPADIAASNDGEVLRRSGTSLGFGTIATAGIGDDQVTFAKMQNIATDRLIGRVSGGSGDPEEVVCTDLAQTLISQSSAAGMQTTIGVRETLDANRTYYVRHKVGTCTISNASPAVVTLNNHGMPADQPIVLSTTGTLPTGLTQGTIYYVKSPTTNSFNVAASPGGAAINTSSSGSGTHSLAAGSDSNNGLSDSPAGAFLTLQHATDVVAGIDLQSHDVTVQCADSYYSAGTAITAPWTGKGTVTLQGNTTTPANCVINASTCISVFGFGRLTVTGFKLISSSIGIYSESGQVIVGAMDFGAIAGFGVWVELGGQARFVSNYTVSGNGSRHFYAITGGSIFGTGITVTTSNTPAFSDAYAYAANCGVIQFQSITYTGTGATGKRYDASYNGVVYTGGGTLPGNVAGTTSTGGQYQ